MYNAILGQGCTLLNILFVPVLQYQKQITNFEAQTVNPCKAITINRNGKWTEKDNTILINNKVSCKTLVAFIGAHVKMGCADSCLAVALLSRLVYHQYNPAEARRHLQTLVFFTRFIFPNHIILDYQNLETCVIVTDQSKNMPVKYLHRFSVQFTVLHVKCHSTKRETE